MGAVLTRPSVLALGIALVIANLWRTNQKALASEPKSRYSSSASRAHRESVSADRRAPSATPPPKRAKNVRTGAPSYSRGSGANFGRASGAQTDWMERSSPLSKASRNVEGVEVFICLDFEWTCDEDSSGGRRKVRADEGEIIEFAFVIYDVSADRVTCRGQHYCKPQRTPITPFCTQLTGISDETVANAGTLQDAIDALERALAEVRAEERVCCTVAHGNCDLELTLPVNAKELGVRLPKVLRRYVDVREATQNYLLLTGKKGIVVFSLKQICAALDIEMVGEEHCGVDDANIVLLVTKALLKERAPLREIDLDVEAKVFLSPEVTNSNLISPSLCLDPLPFATTGSLLRPWLEKQLGQVVPASSLFMVLGANGRPSGKAIVEFATIQDAQNAFRRLEDGRCFAFEDKERHVKFRPLRLGEESIPRQCQLDDDDGNWPAIIAFPMTAQDLEDLRVKSSSQPTQEQRGCVGTIARWMEEKGFGFIRYKRWEVFVHHTQLRAGLHAKEGLVVKFDIKQWRTGNYQACAVQLAR